MTAKILKWGNSAGIRLPSEVLKFLSLHIGDSVEVVQKEDSIALKVIHDKNEKLGSMEVKRIKEHANKEYKGLEHV